MTIKYINLPMRVRRRKIDLTDNINKMSKEFYNKKFKEG